MRGISSELGRTSVGGCSSAANFRCARSSEQYLHGTHRARDCPEGTKGRFIIFGEMHGTAQSPMMVGTVACALAKKGEHILVSVELSSSTNDAIQAAWASPADEFEARVRAIPEWRTREDGVTSRAMLAMLVRLRMLKAAGRAIDIVAFNGPRDERQVERWKALPLQGPHEATQAENIRAAADAARYDHVLILVGGLHARKAKVEWDSGSFEPMAMRLAPPDEVVSLRLAFAAGSAWNCIVKSAEKSPPGADDVDCAAHQGTGNARLKGGPRLGIGAPDVAPDRFGPYDGYYWVGAISASPPAGTALSK